MAGTIGHVPHECKPRAGQETIQSLQRGEQERAAPRDPQEIKTLRGRDQGTRLTLQLQLTPPVIPEDVTLGWLYLMLVMPTKPR